MVYRHPSGTLFGLRPIGFDRFDSERTGLDHVSFAVASRDDLLAAQRAFAEAGINHGEIIDLPASGRAMLRFNDPDGIHLELTAPLEATAAGRC